MCVCVHACVHTCTCIHFLTLEEDERQKEWGKKEVGERDLGRAEQISEGQISR